jgi:26 proteasome complex subunit DSS1
MSSSKKVESSTSSNPPEKEGDVSKSHVEALIEAIEEDDEFEEFDPAKWGAEEEDADDVQQWKDNWDDDDIDDEFTNHLRAELERES